jgi:large subunit ribosomal protein L24e
MVERRVCSFCGAEIEPGTGKLYVKKDGTVLAFDSNKCYKNMIDLGRVPRVTGWTRAYKREKSTRLKGMAVEEPSASKSIEEPMEEAPTQLAPQEPAKEAKEAEAPKEEKPKATKAKKAKKEEQK